MEVSLTFVWGRHAQLDAAAVEATMRENWGARQHNQGRARWRIAAEGIVVTFDCPVDGDHRKVYIHTVWAS
jgi:hypothetical protein